MENSYTFSVAVVVLDGYMGELFKNEKNLKTYNLSNLVPFSRVLKVPYLNCGTVVTQSL